MTLDLVLLFLGVSVLLLFATLVFLMTLLYRLGDQLNEIRRKMSSGPQRDINGKRIHERL